MFSSGIATRSKFKATPRLHIVTTTTTPPATYCTGAPALVETPVNIDVTRRLCRRCLAVARHSDPNVLREVGWPWPDPGTVRADDGAVTP